MLKYPIPKDKRVRLAKLYFALCITPGLPTHILATCAEGLSVLTRSKKKVSVKDMRLSWKPIYRILSKDLFLSRRQFEIRFATLSPLRSVANFLLVKRPSTWLPSPRLLDASSTPQQ